MAGAPPAHAPGALPPRRRAARLPGARSKRFRDNSIDMGTGYDCFDTKSHPFSPHVTRHQRANRMKLRRAMLAAGFKGLDTEWWHFTLRDERFSERYFDFPVSRAALAG